MLSQVQEVQTRSSEHPTPPGGNSACRAAIFEGSPRTFPLHVCVFHAQLSAWPSSGIFLGSPTRCLVSAHFWGLSHLCSWLKLTPYSSH